VKNAFSDIRFFCALAAVCLLCGCFEKERTFILNPDGSGKVLVRELFWLPKELNDAYAMLDDARKAEFNRQWRYGYAEGVMLGNPGMETWKDVTCEPAGGGRWQFTGTAYFRNLGDTSSALGEMHANVSGNGDLLLELFVHRDSAGNSGETEQSRQTLRNVSPERRDEAVQRVNDWIKNLYNASIKVRFQLPGEAATSNDAAIAAESLEVSLDGPAIKAVAELVSSNAVMEITGRGNEAGAKFMQQAVARQLLGEHFNRRVIVRGPMKPLFDYHAEVAAARRAFPKMIQGLGCKNPKLAVFRDAMVLPQNPRGTTNVTDLEFTKLQSGAKGKALGAEIRSIATVSEQSSLILKLNTPKDQLLSLSVYDDEDIPLDGRVTSCTMLGGAAIITWRKEGALPDRGTVKVRLK